MIAYAMVLVVYMGTMVIRLEGFHSSSENEEMHIAGVTQTGKGVGTSGLWYILIAKPSKLKARG